MGDIVNYTPMERKDGQQQPEDTQPRGMRERFGQICDAVSVSRMCFPLLRLSSKGDQRRQKVRPNLSIVISEYSTQMLLEANLSDTASQRRAKVIDCLNSALRSELTAISQYWLH